MTEKNYNPEQRMAKTMKKQGAADLHQHQNKDTHTHEAVKNPENKTEEKKETHEPVQKKDNIEKTKESPPKPSQVKENSPKLGQIKEKPKRTKAVVNAFNLPISTKHSAAICRFIKRKKIQEAVKDLELVANLKKPIPMKGEIPHRKGRMMSGRFPEKAARQFIILLKSLSSGSAYHGLENPIIAEAVANIGYRPFGRRGIRRKRTHIRIVAEEKKSSGVNK